MRRKLALLFLMLAPWLVGFVIGGSTGTGSTGDVGVHETTYDHSAYDTHIADTSSNPHAVDAEDVLEGASPDVTFAGGTIRGTATVWSFPPFPTYTLVASELNDDSDPHVLTSNELKGFILSNSESTGADEWDFPAREEGWDFCFDKEADQNATLDPNGTEQWYYRTDNSAYTQLSAGEALVNTTSGKSTVCCHSTESAVYCQADANWAEETP
jgi:hypothetical protein